MRRILLTASGGPFRSTPHNELSGVTPEQACAHPTWRMGRKISVDSATMMNKGLEVIEARWLFGVPADAIDVVIHPQSIVHSLVEYVDGSVLAQLGNPDMRTPIAQALAWPDRIDAGVAPLDLARPWCARLRSARGRALPVPAASPTMRFAPAGPRRPCSTRPMKSPSPHSSSIASASRKSRRYAKKRCRGLPARPLTTLDEALDADREARALTRQLLELAPGAHASGMMLLQKLLFFAVTLGVLVVFHELGHYVVARLVGVKVLRFSVGFGRILWSRRVGRDRTEWALSAVPLGGYVKMVDEREGEVAPADLGRAFNRQPVWKRIAIVVRRAGRKPAAGGTAFRRHLRRRHSRRTRRSWPRRRPARRRRSRAWRRPTEVVAVNGEHVLSWQDLRWRLLKASGNDDAIRRPSTGRASARSTRCRC